MKNREKYAEEILDIVCRGEGFAMRKDDKRLTACNEISCIDCCFNSDEGCDEATYKWAESEYIEPAKISKKDRVFLDYLKGYEYMTRDGDGELYAYITKPKKGLRNWADARFKSLRGLDIGFPMVKWSDAEPWLIEDLKELEVVDEYE